MRHGRSLGVAAMLGVAAIIVSTTVIATAQIGGKPVSGGNPTPGTPQPDPPNLSDRITVSGCLRAAPKPAGSTEAADVNTPSDARFELANAERVDSVPPGTGGSLLASAPASRTYRLEGIDSQFSPFVDRKVEISGEIKAGANTASGSGAPPTVIVEFVQKLAATCK